MVVIPPIFTSDGETDFLLVHFLILEVVDPFWCSTYGICWPIPSAVVSCYQNWLMIWSQLASWREGIYWMIVYVIFLHYQHMIGLKILCVYTHYASMVACHFLLLSFVTRYFFLLSAKQYSWKLTTIMGNTIVMESFLHSLCDRSSFRKGDVGIGTRTHNQNYHF